MPNGLRIQKDFLKNLRLVFDTEDATLLETINLPFPVEISTGFSEYFEQQYEILTPVIRSYEGIDKVAELLWSYSKSREKLADEADKECWKHVEDGIKNEILQLIRLAELRFPEEEYSEILQTCNDVFDGEIFGDMEINSFF
jgi:hypothetical protein